MENDFLYTHPQGSPSSGGGAKIWHESGSNHKEQALQSIKSQGILNGGVGGGGTVG